MSLIERFYFTYQDYLRYCDYYDVEYTDEGNLCVAEESEEYYYNSDETSNKNRDKKHDKIFKDILDMSQNTTFEYDGKTCPPLKCINDVQLHQRLKFHLQNHRNFHRFLNDNSPNGVPQALMLPTPDESIAYDFP